MRKLNEIRAAVRDRRPLIHCITNPISINQCANAVLAAGARPIMAEHPAEVKEITESADALVLNLGNITDVRMESMEIALRAAKEKGIPVVLDAVGTACSGLRREYAARLLATAKPAVLKGNYSEIYALYRTAYRASGVDADAALGEDEVKEAAGELAGKYGINGAGQRENGYCDRRHTVCADPERYAAAGRRNRNGLHAGSAVRCLSAGVPGNGGSRGCLRHAGMLRADCRNRKRQRHLPGEPAGRPEHGNG